MSDTLTHTFLSDEWFDAVDVLGASAPPPPDGLADLVINLVATEGPGDDIQAHMDAGRIVRGHVDDAPTLLTVPFEVAKALLIDGDPKAAMSAFLTGKILVEGDMTKLLAQASAELTPEYEAFQQQIRAITA